MTLSTKHTTASIANQLVSRVRAIRMQGMPETAKGFDSLASASVAIPEQGNACYLDRPEQRSPA